MQKIDELFAVRYGHGLQLNRLTQCGPEGVAFISRTARNNGLAAYVELVPGVEPAPAGELTCALSGNPLVTFLQERPYYTAFHVARLAPLRPMTKAQLLYYCMCISANRYRYNYGRQANRSIRDIFVPSIKDIPSWVDGASIEIVGDRSAPVTASAPQQIDTTNWRAYRYDELFDIERGRGPRKKDLVVGEGATPFITALGNSNGLTGYTAMLACHEGNTIAVNRNGNGVAQAHYQAAPFCSTEDVHVLRPKSNMNVYRAMFLITLIRRERYRFSYGRKWSIERMKKSVMRLPVRSDSTPDWDFMEQYIKSLSYSSQLARPSEVVSGSSASRVDSAKGRDDMIVQLPLITSSLP